MDRPSAQSTATAPATVQVPKPGDVIEGKYRVEKVLGEGGMGVVLAAHHELLDQRVAVKVLTSSDEKAMSRFSLEAKATAQLKSEHVARVMDVGVLPSGAPFMVMEYLEGCDLEELLRLNARLPVEETVGYMLDALDGLAQAHALEIIHRDLKPANLFLAVQASGTSIVKIVDFGISKSIASRRSGKTGVLTGDHSTVGSPTYMAPEQIRSPKDVDARSDIWSLGVVLYELLAGAPPFRGDSVGEIFAAVLEQKAPPVTSLVPTVPAGLSAVIARCMSRDRDKRYSDVLALAIDLAPFGPPDSKGRLRRIEQTLNAVKRKAEGKEIGRSTARVALPAAEAGPDEVTAERTASPTPGAPATAPGVPAAPPSVPRRKQGPAHATAQHVSFASDATRADDRRVITSPSLRRQTSRRRGLAIAGGASIALIIGLVAIVKATSAPEASGGVAVPRGVPSAMPLPPEPSSTAADQSAAQRQARQVPAAPEVPAVAVDALPTAKAKPANAPAGAPRKSPAASPSKKHLSVLDSPD
jgi:serine/threonine protein kinase